MSEAIWELAGSTARLCVPSADLGASLDLAHAAAGLVQWRFGKRPREGYQLLGVQVPEGRPAEAYARGSDLVVTFPETPLDPLRVQVYWRADPATAAIDVQVSVQTGLLDSHPELATESQVPAGEVLRLMNAEGAEFEPLALDAGGTVSLPRAPGTHCLLFRPAGSEWSYAEMLHPSDYRRDVLSTASDGRAVRLVRSLFAMFLEKGVLLRSRSRGLFVPRHDDARRAAEAYGAFLATEPPLTT